MRPRRATGGVRAACVRRVAWSALALVGCAGVPPPAVRLPPGRHELEVADQGWSRDVVVVVPSGDERRGGSAPRPLVIALHGGGGSADGFEAVTGLTEQAARHGYVVAYPNGIATAPHGQARFWNTGECCGRAHWAGVDDGAFVVRLVDDLADRGLVDPGRVFAVGYSNGGALALRIALRFPGRLRAVAVFGATLEAAGTLDAPELGIARSSSLPALMVVHSVGDPRVPYRGRELDGGRVDAPVESLARSWAVAVGCSSRGALVAELDGALRVRRYGGCGARPVTLVGVVGWDHEWPGPVNLSELDSTRPLARFDAAARMTDFFAAVAGAP